MDVALELRKINKRLAQAKCDEDLEMFSFWTTVKTLLLDLVLTKKEPLFSHALNDIIQEIEDISEAVKNLEKEKTKCIGSDTDLYNLLHFAQQKEKRELRFLKSSMIRLKKMKL